MVLLRKRRGAKPLTRDVSQIEISQVEIYQKRLKEMDIQDPVGIFKFGENKIEADITGKFTVKLLNGGEWVFDLGELHRLTKILKGI